MKYCGCVLGLLLIVSGLKAQPVFMDKTFNLPVNYTATNSMDVESADLDNDGHIDIVVAVEVGENRIFWNDGHGVFSFDTTRRLPERDTTDLQGFPGEDSEDVAIFDVDKDGDPDLLFVSEDTRQHELLLNDGAGNFRFAPYQFPDSRANALAVFDMNGDTYPDVILGNTGANQLYINNGDTTFTNETAARWPGNNRQTQDLKVVDIDNDGDLDVVEGNEQGGNAIYLNVNGAFTDVTATHLPNFMVSLETRKVAVGDVNNDSLPDLFYCNVGWVAGVDLQNRLLINTGNGIFEDVTDSSLPQGSAFTLDAVFLDVNRDGWQDIITVGLANPSKNYEVLYNDGTGKFTDSSDLAFDPFVLSDGIGIHVNTFNADSLPDLYLSNVRAADKLFFSDSSAFQVSNPMPSLVAATADLNYLIKVYPNPSKNSITIKIPEALVGCTYECYHTNGQFIARNKVLNRRRTKIDISNWPAGSYVIRITKEQQTATQTFMKH